LVGTLAHLPERASITALFAISKSRVAAIRKAAEVALSQSASTLGLTPDELADQLVPDVVPAGFTPGKKAPSGGSAEDKAAWKDASAAARAALTRAEKLMTTGRTLGAQSFVETWKLKPLLAGLTARLVWGVFRDDQRVGLMCGGQQAGEVAFDERLRVRPMHPLELTVAERELVRHWVVAGEQPFPQLARQTFSHDQLAGLDRLVGVDVTRGKLMALVAQGWEWTRGDGLDGVERSGGAWSMTVQIAPPFFPGGGTDDPDSSVSAVRVWGAEHLSPVACSELQLQLVRALGEPP
jgi:hypothetical protein